MEITIEKLLDGKATIIKDKEYLATKEYVEPFINIMSKYTVDFHVIAELPNQLVVTDNKDDITYNRVWVQAVMPERDDKEGFAETYNLIYGLDVRQPVYKMFKAYKNRKTNNLFAFDSRWLNVYELKPGTKFIDFEQQIKELMEMVDDSAIRIKKAQSEIMPSDSESRWKMLGELIERSFYYEVKNKGGKVKLAPAMILKLYQAFYVNKNSEFYKGENPASLFEIYNAFSTLILEDSDILNVWEKHALISQLLNEEILWK